MEKKTDPHKILCDAIDGLEKRQSNIRRAISAFKKEGCSTDPCAAAFWIESNAGLIMNDIPDLMEIKYDLHQICQDVIMKFDKDIREALLSEGLSCHGQWPKYYIEHIIPLIIDEKKYNVFIGDVTLKTFSIKKILASIKYQLGKLKTDPVKLKTFLNDFFAAYQKLASNQHRSISIFEIYRELVLMRQPNKLWRNAISSNFRSLSELEFKSYLTQILQHKLTVIADHQLRLLPPISKGESVYIYEPFENRFCHVGRIEFTVDRGQNHE